MVTELDRIPAAVDDRRLWRLVAGAVALAAGGCGAAITAISAYMASGWFLPAVTPGVGIVLCHGCQTGRREMLSLAMALRARGFPVLLFDFRAHGESEGRWTSCGLLETRDLEGAVRYMLTRPEVKGSRVGVVGFSMGAAVSILTAARVPEIGAVAADSSFATLREVVASGYRVIWGLPSFPFASMSLWFAEKLVGVKAEAIRPLDAVASISPRPLLIIHGVADRLVPLRDAYLLYESAGEPKEIWTVPGADHVQARELDLEGYADKVTGFFRTALGSYGEEDRPSTRADGSSRS
ncbi:MAG: alpha/beta hydrolase [Actinobacteria bacterium]|nr:alpha/beta hydrolase [Actinomycetota bacterium]